MNKLTGNRVAENLSERDKLLKNYNTARNNLLLVIIFTVINIVMIVAGTDSYFLFTATIPFLLGVTGISALINFDADRLAVIAEENLLPGTEDYEILMSAEYTSIMKTMYAVLIVIAVVIIALYFVAWLCSKKPEKKGWMVFALVFFILDTIAMVLFMGISADTVMDLVFHAYILFYLIMGVSAAAKLKKLPPEEESAVDVSGPYVAPSPDEVIDPGFTYPDKTTSTLNGESVDTKNE